MTAFTFLSGDDIRVEMRDGEPWFVADDVCKILGILNVSQAVQPLDADDQGICLTYSYRGQGLLAVSESGLYTIILRSRNAVTFGTVAYDFRRWVTKEVLPSIRRTGSYSVPERLASETIDLDNVSAYGVMSRQIQDAWKIRRMMRKSGH